MLHTLTTITIEGSRERAYAEFEKMKAFAVGLFERRREHLITRLCVLNTLRVTESQPHLATHYSKLWSQLLNEFSFLKDTVEAQYRRRYQSAVSRRAAIETVLVSVDDPNQGFDSQSFVSEGTNSGADQSQSPAERRLEESLAAIEREFYPLAWEQDDPERFYLAMIESVVDEIISIERESLPADWIWDRDDYRDRVLDPNAVHVFLKIGEWVTGYVLGIPHNEAVADLRDDDPLMVESSQKMYCETIELSPLRSKFLGSRELIRTFLEQIRNRGFFVLSFHARESTGFASMLRRMFRKRIIIERRIDNWPHYSGKEPAIYMELDLSS